MKGFRVKVLVVLISQALLVTANPQGYGGGYGAPSAAPVTHPVAPPSPPAAPPSPPAAPGHGGGYGAPPAAPPAETETQSGAEGLFPAAPAPANLPVTPTHLNLPVTDVSSVASLPGPPPPPAPSSSGGAIVGGNCQQTNVGGRYKVVCSGPEKEALKSEHVLWLQSEGQTPSIVDIEIPNYKIEELIKAGFKPGPQRDAIINVLLKKPTTSVDAQVDKQTSSASVPKVNLNYETGSQKLTHFPVDQPYSPLVGPLLPPNTGVASTSVRRIFKRKRTPSTSAPVKEAEE